MNDARTQMEVLLARLDEPVSDVESEKHLFDEVVALSREPEARDLMLASREGLYARRDAVNAKLAGVVARLAAVVMLLYTPAEDQPGANVRFTRGAEIALAGLYLLEHSGDHVPLDMEAGPLEEADDPDFASYGRVFGSAVALLSTAAYFLLDPADTRPALLSSPPEQEAFPPLPFPRLWVEMSHLTPLLRLNSESFEGRLHESLDLLGVGIVEVEQGRVWDIYLPFQFSGDTEFFFLAGRISPNGIVAIDPTLTYGEATFARIREIAVGVVHLVTARNVAAEHVPLPRAQRRRIARSGGSSPSLYYVDLAQVGEHEATGKSGREYHVRWLVRGHWRHVTNGRTFCTCCDPARIASWVAPYIKGPAGAPWKGKQIHRHAA